MSCYTHTVIFELTILPFLCMDEQQQQQQVLGNGWYAKKISDELCSPWQTRWHLECYSQRLCVCVGSAYLLSGTGVDVALHFISCLFRCWSHFSPLFLCHSYFELLVIKEVASIQSAWKMYNTFWLLYSFPLRNWHFRPSTVTMWKTVGGSVSSAFCVVPGMVPTEHTMGEFCKTKPSKSAHEIAEIVLRIAAS